MQCLRYLLRNRSWYPLLQSMALHVVHIEWILRFNTITVPFVSIPSGVQHLATATSQGGKENTTETSKATA